MANVNIAKGVIKHKVNGTYHIWWGLNPSKPVMQIMAISVPIDDPDDLDQTPKIQEIRTYNPSDPTSKPLRADDYVFRHGGAPWAEREVV